MKSSRQSRRNLFHWAIGAGAGAALFAAPKGVRPGPIDAAAEPPPSAADRPCRAGCVVVTPEGPRDGGQFGKYTPATRTSGLQEAFDYAKAKRKDIYITGGAMPKQFTAGAYYQLDETLRIPWMQDFRLDGGEYNLVYTGTTGPAVLIDSQMNCRYKFGKVIAARSDGPVVHLKPETLGPDNFRVITATVFELNVVLGAGGAWPGAEMRGKGTGLLLDATTGGIHYNRISVVETVGCDRGVHACGRGVANNELGVLFCHLCNTHVRLGDPGEPAARNQVALNLIDGEGIPGSTGVEIFGHANLLTVNVARTAPGRNLVFAADARDNLVLAINLPDGITNDATTPTNRIVPLQPVGMSIATPPAPASGQETVNRHPYPVEVLFLTGGQVEEWTVTDANANQQSVAAGITPGQTLVLQPGERIQLTGTEAPTWRWKALG